MAKPPTLEQTLATLRARAALATPEDVQWFDAALADAAKRAKPRDLPALFAVFRDDTQQHEVMWGLVHLVEDFPNPGYVKALVAALPDLRRRAPEWAELLSGRANLEVPRRGRAGGPRPGRRRGRGRRP